MVQKNGDYEVDIIDEGYEGEGIAKIDGYTTFIKGALAGEKTQIKILKANKDFGFGKILNILKVSKNRQEPVCEVYNRCGGCSLQHMDYEYQLVHKTNIVKNTLKKALKYEVNVNDTIGMGIPYNYRNKAQYPVSKNMIGFYADRSHDIVQNEQCYIQNKVSDNLAKDAFKLIQKHNVSIYDEKTGKGLMRHILTRIAINTNELMLVFVTNGEEFKEKDLIVKDIIMEYPKLNSIVQNINKENSNVILGDKCITLYGDEYITDILGDFKFKISPLSFYQVNPVQTELLYNTAKEFADLTGKETVFDLYSGIGTISIFMSDKAKKVYSVEVVEDAVKDAIENAKINNIDNIEFIQGEAEKVAPELYEKNIKADVVFIDPPRKGCEQSLLSTIVEMNAKKVIYISCNPATLARDLKYLSDNGYKIEKVQPVDMFPQTSHVETVVLMSQR
jgi:23S rRNA (uracil1939-C5)-methyltransferase